MYVCMTPCHVELYTNVTCWRCLWMLLAHNCDIHHSDTCLLQSGNLFPHSNMFLHHLAWFCTIQHDIAPFKWCFIWCKKGSKFSTVSMDVLTTGSNIATFLTCSENVDAKTMYKRFIQVHSKFSHGREGGDCSLPSYWLLGIRQRLLCTIYRSPRRQPWPGQYSYICWHFLQGQGIFVFEVGSFSCKYRSPGCTSWSAQVLPCLVINSGILTV